MPSFDTVGVAVKERIDKSLRGDFVIKPQFLNLFYSELEKNPKFDFRPSLDWAEKFNFIPLFDVVTDALLADLRQNPSNYSVSSMEYAGKNRKIPLCNYFQKNRVYELTISNPIGSGKVLMIVQKEDMNVYPRLFMDVTRENLRRHQWMTRRLDFEGDRPYTKIFNRGVVSFLRQFSRQHGLEELMGQAREGLKDINIFLEESLRESYFC